MNELVNFVCYRFHHPFRMTFTEKSIITHKTNIYTYIVLLSCFFFAVRRRILLSVLCVVLNFKHTVFGRMFCVQFVLSKEIYDTKTIMDFCYLCDVCLLFLCLSNDFRSKTEKKNQRTRSNAKWE